MLKKDVCTDEELTEMASEQHAVVTGYLTAQGGADAEKMLRDLAVATALKDLYRKLYEIGKSAM